MYGVFGREEYSKNCEEAGGVFYRQTGGLKENLIVEI
jgi:hypothetical protein